jgi:hypothetical protein
MITGLIALASVVAVFIFGVLIGYRLNERKLAVRVRRQAAAQSSLYRQLKELQDARQRDCPPQLPRDYSSRTNAQSYLNAVR